jgi:hypothetical protein
MKELVHFPERLKRALIRSFRVMRMKRSTAFVFLELIDNPKARYWSNDRMAAACHFHVRTVELALAELRVHGFISMQYRRKMTAVKHICVDAVLLAVKHGVEAAKRACEAAKSLIRRGFQDPQRTAAYIHSCFKKGDADAPWRVQGPAPDYLLRFMGLPTGERRR